ncbi:hypothetical protein PR003_g1631 [Phytophthora rubi]|uniref:Uncharacterized protein n=1 Tax=Phytophthora rubi TaxID=129364 RepID=A0A6A4G6Z6_9STRA|nr:hypothetical protein PR003_g1631 [Phytophthora rubi]
MSGKKQIKVAAGLGLEEPGPNSPDHSSQNNRNLPEQHQPAKSDLVIRKLLNFGRKLAAGYNKLQISHRGMYSIERLHAYQAYCDKTSTVRAIAVCVLTPVPSLLAIVLIECFPLRDPLLGWEANYMFWIRFYISGVLICIGLTYQATDMVDRVKISLLQRLVMSIVAMSIYVGTVMLVSYLWIFPVPFGIVLGIGPCFAVFLTALIVTIGPTTFKANPGLGDELKLQFYVLATEGAISVIYPAFSSVYLRASSTGRAGLVLLLPVIKILTKNIVAWSSSHVEDCIPVVTVFSIEVFNALYVATCMQSTKSTLVTIIIITSDVLNVVLAFRSLLHRSRALEDQHRRSQLTASEGNKHEPVELMTTVMTSFQHLRTFRTRKGREIRYHALVEYVECAVPILFGVYLTILYQLPVHEYYPHTRDLEAGQLEGMLMSLSVYVTLEVLSFVGMHMALKRKFHLSALYQLAFVLETHVVQLQSRMFVWIVFILQFTLAHYGVDFTFQFAWLH